MLFVMEFIFLNMCHIKSIYQNSIKRLDMIVLEKCILSHLPLTFSELILHTYPTYPKYCIQNELLSLSCLNCDDKYQCEEHGIGKQCEYFHPIHYGLQPCAKLKFSIYLFSIQIHLV
jgi:hypothetical protein